MFQDILRICLWKWKFSPCVSIGCRLHSANRRTTLYCTEAFYFVVAWSMAAGHDKNLTAMFSAPNHGCCHVEHALDQAFGLEDKVYPSSYLPWCHPSNAYLQQVEHFSGMVLSSCWRCTWHATEQDGAASWSHFRSVPHHLTIIPFHMKIRPRVPSKPPAVFW